MTQAYSDKNPIAPIRITSSDALPLSYGRLVGAKAIKLGSIHKTNRLHTAKIGMSCVAYMRNGINVMD